MAFIDTSPEVFASRVNRTLVQDFQEALEKELMLVACKTCKDIARKIADGLVGKVYALNDLEKGGVRMQLILNNIPEEIV